MHFVQVSAQLQSVTKKIGANKNCTISGWQDVNDLMHKFFGVFQKKFLRNYLVYRAQIFRDNRYCFVLSIFRNFILLASLDNDKPMLMRQKNVNKDSPFHTPTRF